MPPFNDDPTQGAWLSGPKITREQLKEGSGSVEHLPRGALRGGKPPTPGRGTAPATASRQGATMWLGKHRGRLLVDVRDQEPGYWSWACSEIDGFEAKVRKLGLLDDDDS